MITENERITLDFLDALNIADFITVKDCLSDDFEFISPSKRTLDKETLCQNLPRTYEMIPDNRFNLIRILSQDDSVVMVTNRRGTFKKGTYFGVEANNQSFEIPFINIFDIEAGKIKRWEAHWNVQLLQQSQQK